jgi:hypothetical protein
MILKNKKKKINDMLTEYETHSTLNPKLWDGDQLHPKLRIGLIRIAKAFYKFLDIDVNIKDILLIGSNANYNWTEHSDIDLHVLVNYLDIDANYHVVSEFMHAKKSIWNNSYPLTYKGMNIELYAQDSKQELHSTVGVYSIMRGKWIKKPSADIVSVDDDAIKMKAEPYQYEIDKLNLEDSKIEFKIQNLKRRLKDLRQTGLDAEGEYSVENMAYKHLRNKGYLERLKQLEKKVTMSKLTVEHVANEHDMQNIAEIITGHILGHTPMQRDDWHQVATATNAIVDSSGQWSHPGRCTIIPTTDGSITMQDVTYPVFAFDETGHHQLMQPDQQYSFPGVTIFEIPHTAQWQTMIMQIQNAVNNGRRYAK